MSRLAAGKLTKAIKHHSSDQGGGVDVDEEALEASTEVTPTALTRIKDGTGAVRQMQLHLEAEEELICQDSAINSTQKALGPWGPVSRKSHQQETRVDTLYVGHQVLTSSNQLQRHLLLVHNLHEYFKGYKTILCLQFKDKQMHQHRNTIGSKHHSRLATTPHNFEKIQLPKSSTSTA